MWVPFHIHTIHSALDGAINPSEYRTWAELRKVPAVAVTDHYTLSGLVDMEKAFVKSSVKPIFGCELGCEPITEAFGTTGRNYGHLTAWAMNERGLANLIALSSKAYANIKKKPLVNRAMLEEHHEGIAFGSACQAGELQNLLELGMGNAASDFASFFVKTLSVPFYGEVMRVHTSQEEMKREKRRNEMVRDFCVSSKIPYIVTSDSHYLERMREFHGTMLEIKRLSTSGRKTGQNAITRNSEPDIERESTSLRRLGWMNESSLALPEDLEEFERSWRESGYGDGIDETFRLSERMDRLNCRNERSRAGGWLFPENRSIDENGSPTVKESFRDRALRGFEGLVSSGLVERSDRERYREQLEREMSVVEHMGFPDYFMLVSDITGFARSAGILMGPGRGSAAGSMLAWSMGITNVDPIRYNLVFERFLNPERISMPDIDLDFEDSRRGEVIDYIRRSYGTGGELCVTGIANITTIKWKSAVRDSLRAHFPDDETSAVMRLAGALGDMTDRYEAEHPDPDDAVREMIDELHEHENLCRAELRPMAERAIRQAAGILGQVRGIGRHASGIVVAPRNIMEFAPVWRMSKDSEDDWMTQYDMAAVEHAGLIKIDCLGLSQLRAIRRTCEIAESSHEGSVFSGEGHVPGPEAFFRWMNRQGSKNALATSTDPEEDIVAAHADKAWDLLAAGNSTGVFQLESSGMRRLLSDIEPKDVDDLSSLVALYRPGPLSSGLTDAFSAARIRSRANILMKEYSEGMADSDTPRRCERMFKAAERKERSGGSASFPSSMSALVKNDVASDADGFPIYQEHILKLSRVLAGFSLGGADLLRRAMGKKKPEEMARQYGKFMKGATEKGYSVHDADAAFTVMEHFAAYGFNKAHSTAYAFLAFYTAWLKAVYPLSFMAAFLEVRSSEKDKKADYIRETMTTTGLALPVLCDATRGAASILISADADKDRYYTPFSENVFSTSVELPNDVLNSTDQENETGPLVPNWIRVLTDGPSSLSVQSVTVQTVKIEDRENKSERKVVPDEERRKKTGMLARTSVGRSGIPSVSITAAAKYTKEPDSGYEDIWTRVLRPSDIVSVSAQIKDGLFSPVQVLGCGMVEPVLGRMLLSLGYSSFASRIALRAWFLTMSPDSALFARSAKLLNEAANELGFNEPNASRGKNWFREWMASAAKQLSKGLGVQVSKTNRTTEKAFFARGRFLDLFDRAAKVAIEDGIRNINICAAAVSSVETELFGTSITVPEWNTAIVCAHLFHFRDLYVPDEEEDMRDIPDVVSMSRNGRDLFDSEWTGYGMTVENRKLDNLEYRMIDNCKYLEDCLPDRFSTDGADTVVLCGILRNVQVIDENEIFQGSKNGSNVRVLRKTDSRSSKNGIGRLGKIVVFRIAPFGNARFTATTFLRVPIQKQDLSNFDIARWTRAEKIGKPILAVSKGSEWIPSPWNPSQTTKAIVVADPYAFNANTLEIWQSYFHIS